MKLSTHSFTPALVFLVAVTGCASVECPSGNVDVDGTCIPIEDFCDENETFVDGVCVTECTSGETRVCGSDEGECRSGAQTCIDNAWGACEREITPTDELCDGLDNDCDGVADNSTFAEVCDGVDDDCDGLVDEGVMTVKQLPQETGVGSVAAVGDGFVVGLWDESGSTLSLYSGQGDKTGEFVSLGVGGSAFGSMFVSGSAIWVVHSLGDEEDGTLEVVKAIHSDGNLSIESRGGTDSSWTLSSLVTGNNRPRLFPILAIGLIGIGNSALQGVLFGGTNSADAEPWPVESLSLGTKWDVADPARFAWIEDGNVLVGQLGFPGVTITITGEQIAGQGSTVGLVGGEVFGVAFVDDAGKARLSELGTLLDCVNNRLCKFNLGDASGLIDLEYRHSAWFVAAGKKTFVISRDGQELLAPFDRTAVADIDDIQLAHNGLVTAIVDSDTQSGAFSLDPISSGLTFIGCLDD